MLADKPAVGARRIAFPLGGYVGPFQGRETRATQWIEQCVYVRKPLKNQHSRNLATSAGRSDAVASWWGLSVVLNVPALRFGVLGPRGYTMGLELGLAVWTSRLAAE